jgi:signal transduction histidine kinase
MLALFFLETSSAGFAADQPDEIPAVQYSVDGGNFKDITGPVKISAESKAVSFQVESLVWPNPNPLQDPVGKRLLSKLEGVDENWIFRRGGYMGLVVRFHDHSENLTIGQKDFFVDKESPGWDVTMQHPHFNRRHEFLTVPSGAEWMSLAFTSAGPPDGIGAYIAANLAVYRRTASGETVRIFATAFSPGEDGDDLQKAPAGWGREGLHTSMAKMMRIEGLAPPSLAFGIVDNDPAAHAEWHLGKSAYVPVKAGDKLMIEWDEAYSNGLSSRCTLTYKCPPPGNYKLRLKILNAVGFPESERAIEVIVVRPYWMQPWFLLSAALVLVVGGTFGVRAIIRSRVRSHLARLEQEHMVERERLRIARNIHDDLGARLTHISLITGRAENEDFSAGELRKEFRKVSGMTKDLIAALYETVWSVNPENDHLDTLIDYLAQMAENMCEPAGIPCRVSVPESVRDRSIRSGIRHTVSLVMKEALHNAIKYSEASEISAKFTVDPQTLLIEIRDNGSGFDASGERGNGLNNMAHRMREIGGSLKIETAKGEGTAITLLTPIL